MMSLSAAAPAPNAFAEKGATIEHRMNDWQKQAEAGNAEAALALGDAYAHGRSGAKNLDASVRYYGMAVDLGSEVALIKMKKLPPAYTVSWWEQRADKGDASAWRDLAESYCMVEGRKADWETAARYYGRAADAGDQLAVEQMNSLPYEYTCFWWEKKALDGDADAANLAAKSYEIGRGTEADLQQAVRYYAVAAESGDAAALEKLTNLPLSDTLGWWDSRACGGELAASLYLANAYGTGQFGAYQVIVAGKYAALAAMQGDSFYRCAILGALALFILLLIIRHTRSLAFALAMLSLIWFSTLLVLG